MPEQTIPDGHSFALLLTHDVDRPYKTYQSAYYALRDLDPYHLWTLRDLYDTDNPFWQFEEIRELEDELGVRSAFYFLNERRLFRDKPVREWVRPKSWQLYAGRYSIDSPAIVDVMRELDRGGWEVGLHGSYDSHADRERLGHEKEVLEGVLGSEVVGGRQHYLNLDVPDTWRYQADAGLRYDASLGSRDEYGFEHGYGVKRPFDDEFVVFPLTIMENTLPDPGDRPRDAWRECERLLEEARANDAVMTILWHPNRFNEREFPGYRELYARIVERAQELGAWIGPPAELYERLEHSNARRTDAR
jgi:peptidoglycan/xylan/chitin deacetylase (PgdA/CDA1 family)